MKLLKLIGCVGMVMVFGSAQAACPTNADVYISYQYSKDNIIKVELDTAVACRNKEAVGLGVTFTPRGYSFANSNSKDYMQVILKNTDLYIKGTFNCKIAGSVIESKEKIFIKDKTYRDKICGKDFTITIKESR